MIALLDANLLIALFDPAHVNHTLAHTWLTCKPFIRLGDMSVDAECLFACPFASELSCSPGDRRHLRDACRTRSLRPTMCSGRTQFLSVMPTVFASIKFSVRVTSPIFTSSPSRWNTTARLVTFDHGIPLAAVCGAQAKHLEIV